MAKNKTSSGDKDDQAEANTAEAEESGPGAAQGDGDAPADTPGGADAETPPLEAAEHDPRDESFVTYPAKDDPDAAAEPEAPEPEPEVTAATAEPVPPAPVPAPTERRGGFFPGLLGGLIAAAIIVAGYHFATQEPVADDPRFAELSQGQTEQADALSALRDEMAAGPDLSAVTSGIEAVQGSVSDLSGRVDGLASDIAAMQDRIVELEKRPLAEAVSQQAIAAYEGELDRLREAMAAQREEVEALVAEAQQMENEASATAEATLRRAALTRILSALDNGSPYASALADLQAAGQEVPEALATAADSGVPSLAELRDSFPDAARRALSAARAETDGTVGSLGAFLRSQLGARSLEPREGSDPDAVLSRAEAAVRAGRLGDALAEIEALPDAARAELSAWTEAARTRQSAVSAAETLSAELNAG